VIRTLFRGVALLLLWVLLTGGPAASWVVGAPAVLAAVFLAQRLRPSGPARLRPLPALAFLPYFAGQSLRGGWDVARRALHPALPIAPAQITYPCRLPVGTARRFFVNAISLLPGTLYLDEDADGLRLHVVDRDQPVMAELGALEARVARLFGLPRPGEAR